MFTMLYGRDHRQPAKHLHVSTVVVLALSFKHYGCEGPQVTINTVVTKIHSANVDMCMSLLRAICKGKI